MEFPDKDFIYNKLKEMEAGCWAEIERIKTQFCATPEMWENMALMFDETEFQEVVALRGAQKKLREWWAGFKEELVENVKQSKAK